MKISKPETDSIELVFLIDKSGSMYGSEEDIVGGFNAFIDNQLQKDVKTTVTTIFFNHAYEVVYNSKELADELKLKREDYCVGGATALFDAIGKAVISTEKNLGSNSKVLFVIMTDGKENSSVEFSKSQIRKMIDGHDWEFIFLGADIDSYSEAEHIGIKKSRVANYRKSDVGVERAYASISNAVDFMRDDISLDNDDWKDELREYD